MHACCNAYIGSEAGTDMELEEGPPLTELQKPTSDDDSDEDGEQEQCSSRGK